MAAIQLLRPEVQLELIKSTIKYIFTNRYFH